MVVSMNVLMEWKPHNQDLQRSSPFFMSDFNSPNFQHLLRLPYSGVGVQKHTLWGLHNDHEQW